MTKNKSSKSRNFATVVYPESAPDDWLKILENTRVKSFVSPLHDSDVNPDGEIKKPHFHVLLVFDGPVTEEYGSSVLKSFGGVGRETVNSVRGYARYLCHLDDPSKAQYREQDVIAFNGADYAQVIALPSDKYQVVSEMLDWVVDNKIVTYKALMIFAKNERPSWFRALCDNCTMVMYQFIRSQAWELEQVSEAQHGRA